MFSFLMCTIVVVVLRGKILAIVSEENRDQLTRINVPLLLPWSRVCGYVFKRGDIAWNCRRCQVDSTCVQCDACFRRSDHTGHPVRFAFDSYVHGGILSLFSPPTHTGG